MYDRHTAAHRRIRVRPQQGQIQVLAPEDRQAETGDLEIGQQREESPEEAFDKIWMAEHLNVCLRQVKSEVEPQTYEAFRRYVIEQEPIERVAEALQLTENNLYKIKWRVTQKLQETMSVLLGAEE